MHLEITASPTAIAQAINEFSSDYHANYSAIREIRQRYLAAPVVNAHELAENLDSVLHNWGAGKRRAPAVRPVNELAAFLSDQGIVGVLNRIAAHSISNFGVFNGRRTINNVASEDQIDQLDNDVIFALRSLAAGVLTNNTNVTYPMKSLLLLTGNAPAFDSQVRGGLAAAGFRGFSNTRMLLPRNDPFPNAERITRLPFVLGQCWNDFKEVLRDSLLESQHPNLADEPGRVFDVLLFMQGAGSHQLLECVGDNMRWPE